MWSLRTEDRWGRGVRTATCGEHDHIAPQNGCTCGIYAWYSAPARTASVLTPELVAGAVALWGQIELHAHGMRAQHATIVALALPYSRGPKRERLIACARALEVPAVPARRLTAAALEHGDPVPPWMRPPDLEPNKRKAPGPPGWSGRMVADGYRR